MEEWKNAETILDLLEMVRKTVIHFIIIFELPGTIKDHSCKTARFLEFS